jgi:hypothetical protein
MKSGEVALGAVVRESLGREGIVLSREDTPPQTWLDEQVDADEVKKLGPDVRWWGVMPFRGGYLLCPEPMLTWLRPASFEDFLRAVEHTGVDGRLKLAKVFPQYVDHVLEQKKQGGA